MPDLIPVEGNPFNINLVPVEGNPFSLQGDVGAAIQQQNAVEAQRRTTAGGMLQHFMTPGRVAQGVQTETPGVMTEADAFRQNQLEDQARNFGTQQAFNTVFGNVPMSQAGALGAGGGGIKAYHGSPYDFERFDLSKIGTGEGAQAYGHGLYFAENPSVATNYRPHFNEPDKYVWNGQNLSDLQMKAQDKGDYGAAGVLERIQLHQPRHAIEQYFSEDPHDPQSIRALEYLKTVPESVFAKPSGKMYEVNINADPEHFLDWDKPLSEQHPKVQEAIKRQVPMMPDVATGQQIHDALKNRAMSALEPNERQALEAYEPYATSALREAGIPGIKYLDQGSRGQQFNFYTGQNPDGTFKVIGGLKGQPDSSYGSFPTREAAWDEANKRNAEGKTSNYVVFNDKLIDIIKKYGLAGLVAGGASHFTTTPIDHNPFAAQQ